MRAVSGGPWPGHRLVLKIRAWASTRSTLSPAPLSVVTRSEPSGVGVTDRKRPNWFSNPKVPARRPSGPSALRRRKISFLALEATHYERTVPRHPMQLHR